MEGFGRSPLMFPEWSSWPATFALAVGWFWPLMVLAVGGATLLLYRLYKKPSKIGFYSCAGFITVFLITWLSIHWRPWWPRHVFEEVKPLTGVVNEILFLFLHVLIYAGAFVMVWVVQRKLAGRQNHQDGLPLRRVMEWMLGIVVVLVVVVDTCLVNHLIREVAAEESRLAIERTNKLTNNLLFDPEHKTSSFVIRDQAVTKIMSQIYTIINSDFPEIKLQTVSLHLVFSNGPHSGKIWDVVQIGRESKDREFLNSTTDGVPGALVAASIQLNRTMYCADVRQPSKEGDCEYYNRPPTPPDYVGIACFPLEPTLKTSPPDAGICIDGSTTYKWYDRLDALAAELNAQSTNLVSFLEDYRKHPDCTFVAARAPTVRN